MISFPHIHLFHNVLAYVEHVNTDPEVPKQYRIDKPVTFKGTIKLHGSNCGVVMDVATGALQAQSREIDLTPEADYKGFAKFVEANAVGIRGMIRKDVLPKITGTVHKVALYGEWVGAGVVKKTKGVAVSKFTEKHWALFATFAVIDDDIEARNVSDLIMDLPLRHYNNTTYIGNVRQAGNWSITVNFSDSASIEWAQTEAARIIATIEKQCPYGAIYGLEGAGEGIVWMPTGEFTGREDLYWKFKTDAHSVVLEPKMVKERPIVADDVLAAIEDFVTRTVTSNRLEQGLDALEQQGLKTEKRNTGKFIQWVVADVERECALELEDAGLADWSQVSAAVTVKARDFFLAASA